MALAQSRQIVNGEVNGVVATEGWHQGAIQSLDEAVAYANGVPLLGSERMHRFEHALVMLDNTRGHGLAVWASRSLTNVLQDSVGLVAVPKAQLSEDQQADLAKTKLEYLGLNRLADRHRVNVGIT
jgi:hypothetical protein